MRMHDDGRGLVAYVLSYFLSIYLQPVINIRPDLGIVQQERVSSTSLWAFCKLDGGNIVAYYLQNRGNLCIF